jgi:hypothetical protein
VAAHITSKDFILLKVGFSPLNEIQISPLSASLLLPFPMMIQPTIAISDHE